jgi:hypothetical protein
VISIFHFWGKLLGEGHGPFAAFDLLVFRPPGPPGVRAPARSPCPACPHGLPDHNPAHDRLVVSRQHWPNLINQPSDPLFDITPNRVNTRNIFRTRSTVDRDQENFCFHRITERENQGPGASPPWIPIHDRPPELNARGNFFRGFHRRP